ncbi:hypothetical protein [Marinobacterium stanieri]|uniref:hypothetical protein n=1 Tax=Marinobacterium stanieri TaxID=49186 RepID=UPI003A8ED1CE
MAAATELPAYTPFNLADSIGGVVMKRWGTGLCALLFAAGLQAEAVHDTGHHHQAAHTHAGHMGSSPVNNLKEPGQSAFAAIQTMVSAHAGAMNGIEGWALSADLIENGAVLTATGEDVERIRGLGFIGLMTVGMHHQAHHLALAKGQNPHAH